VNKVLHFVSNGLGKREQMSTVKFSGVSSQEKRSEILYYEEGRVRTSSSCVLSSLPLSLCFMLRRLTHCTVISSYSVEHVLYQEALQRGASLSIGAPLRNLVEWGSYTGDFEK